MASSPVDHLLLADQQDPILLASLLEMGLPETRAKKALSATNNSSVEAALTWAFDHAGDPGIDDVTLTLALTLTLIGPRH